MSTTAAPPWALILAGGDGTRLRALTRQITGEPRPKQFCPLLDGETLLDRTRRRVDRLTRADRQVVVVTRAHEPYYRPLVGDLAPGRLVSSRATAEPPPACSTPSCESPSSRVTSRWRYFPPTTSWTTTQCSWER
jgi:MobA-like NTP transferase domain